METINNYELLGKTVPYGSSFKENTGSKGNKDKTANGSTTGKGGTQGNSSIKTRDKIDNSELANLINTPNNYPNRPIIEQSLSFSDMGRKDGYVHKIRSGERNMFKGSAMSNQSNNSKQNMKPPVQAKLNDKMLKTTQINHSRPPRGIGYHDKSDNASEYSDQIQFKSHKKQNLVREDELRTLPSLGNRTNIGTDIRLQSGDS